MVDPHGGGPGRRMAPRRAARDVPRRTARRQGDGPRQLGQRPSLRRADRIGRRRLGLSHPNSKPAGAADAPGDPHVRPPLGGVGRAGGRGGRGGPPPPDRAVRQPARIESGRMEAVSLSPLEKEGNRYQHYAGKWFSLDSTADERTTRRIIVRVEQIFAAYRQALSPRNRPRAPPRLAVFRSMEQYLAFLSLRGVKIGNRACFLEDENVVAVGSDLARLSVRMEKINRQSDEILRQLEELEKAVAGAAGENRRQRAEGKTGRRRYGSSVAVSTTTSRRKRRNWTLASGRPPRSFRPAPANCSRASTTKRSTPTWRITSFPTRRATRRGGSTRGWPSCSRAAI